MDMLHQRVATGVFGPLLLLLGLIRLLKVTTALKPQDNSLLEGLYKSGGNYCTQVCAGSTWQAHPGRQWCCAAWQKAFGSMGSSSSSACTVCFGQAQTLRMCRLEHPLQAAECLPAALHSLSVVLLSCFMLGHFDFVCSVRLRASEASHTSWTGQVGHTASTMTT
jgi:hypothetical protein